MKTEDMFCIWMSFAYNAGLWNFMLKPTKRDTEASQF